LVMIEAMACGTPIIARRRGSVPEVMEEGVTGFTYDTVEEAIQLVQGVASLSRKECRRAFEKRFTVAQMAQAYLVIYKRVLGRPEKLAA
ncbi:MAG: glycosyltransferase, partial [candidate division NC10 bacterium]